MCEVTVGGNPVKLKGECLNIGDKTQKVVLPNKALEDVNVGGESDYVQIIATIPSLDTPVCASETRRFNEKAASIQGAKLIIVSMDLPFAMNRFCTTEGIENLVVASDFRSKEFGEKFGVLINEGKLQGLLARAVFVVDKNGNLAYKEIVKEVTIEPNYDELAKAVGKLLGGSCGCCCGH